jgi:copper chaperone
MNRKVTMTETAPIEQHYLVEGMTCNHCVTSVTEEVSEIAGVEHVSVDLRVGGASDVTVVSSVPMPLEGIRAAITEAGYVLVTA